VATASRLAPALIALAALAGCATQRDSVAPPPPSTEARPTPEEVRRAPEAAPPPRAEKPSLPLGQTGYASWYGRWHHGRETSSGEPYDMHELTAAHPSLPMGTRVQVTNLRNGRSVEVRVNDRGPTVEGRIIDLSYAAARALDAVRAGVVLVRLRVLALPSR
jgi:rare lipoprotein A